MPGLLLFIKLKKKAQAKIYILKDVWLELGVLKRCNITRLSNGFVLVRAAVAAAGKHTQRKNIFKVLNNILM